MKRTEKDYREKIKEIMSLFDLKEKWDLLEVKLIMSHVLAHIVLGIISMYEKDDIEEWSEERRREETAGLVHILASEILTSVSAKQNITRMKLDKNGIGKQIYKAILDELAYKGKENGQN